LRRRSLRRSDIHILAEWADRHVDIATVHGCIPDRSLSYAEMTYLQNSHYPGTDSKYREEYCAIWGKSVRIVRKRVVIG